MLIKAAHKVAAVCLSVFAWCTAWADDTPLSLDTLLSRAEVTQAAISPDGKHVAAITVGDHGDSVVLIRTDTFEAERIVFEGRLQQGFYIYRKAPLRVSWVTNTVMAVDYGKTAEAHDLSGKKVAYLGAATIGKVIPSAPDSPLMLVFRDEERTMLAIANVSTQELQALRLPGLGDPRHWAFDDRGTLRAVTMASAAFWTDSATITQWYRASADDPWEKLEESGINADHWAPLGIASNTNNLVVLSRQDRDTYALFNFDPVKRKRGELLAGYATEDITGIDEAGADSFKTVVTSGMKPVRRWFDKRWADLQVTVDDALPGRINRLSGNPHGVMLVFSYSDVDPGRWYLLDTATMTQRVVAIVNSKIDPARMRPMEIMRYPARDGLSIPAYLTLPNDQAGPHPMVVMVHGGPTARDRWGWDREVQLLASRGYAVFQPQFRGSAGFGKAFETSGYGQWGRAMQDDITAGVERLVQQGIADPRRICIYGASYGGYAALWGLIKTPELYRCGISFAGVSDIEYMLTDRSDTNSNRFGRELMRFRVGDRLTDRQRFDEVSPLKHAQRIQAPLLLVHGEKDERVPMSHSTQLMKAMDAHKKPYEWLPIEKEGHGLYYLRSVRKFSEALLAFLDKHIGTRRVDAAKGAASAPP